MNSFKSKKYDFLLKKNRRHNMKQKKLKVEEQQAIESSIKEKQQTGNIHLALELYNFNSLNMTFVNTYYKSCLQTSKSPQKRAIRVFFSNKDKVNCVIC